MSASSPAIVHDRYDDLYLRRILRETRTIAMVGLSANWNRPSYFAAKYLLDRGSSPETIDTTLNVYCGRLRMSQSSQLATPPAMWG